MTDEEFPDFEEHLEEHSFFLRHVEDLCKDLETNGFSPELSREVIYYVVEWFIQHILLLDMQLVDFLKIRHQKLRYSICAPQVLVDMACFRQKSNDVGQLQKISRRLE